jgi:hypothetical protein
MAERRQRQAADRWLISDRTAKGLRTLVAPQRVHRDRTGRGVAARQPLNLADYLSVPPEEMDLDDDNDSPESMIDPPGAIEGVRITSDLYTMRTPTPTLVRPFFRLFFFYLELYPSLDGTTYLLRDAVSASYAPLCQTTRGLGSPS